MIPIHKPSDFWAIKNSCWFFGYWSEISTCCRELYSLQFWKLSDWWHNNWGLGDPWKQKNFSEINKFVSYQSEFLFLQNNFPTYGSQFYCYQSEIVTDYRSHSWLHRLSPFECTPSVLNLYLLHEAQNGKPVSFVEKFLNGCSFIWRLFLYQDFTKEQAVCDVKKFVEKACPRGCNKKINKNKINKRDRIVVF